MFDFKPAETKGPVRVLKGGLLIDGNGGKPVQYRATSFSNSQKNAMSSMK